MTTDRLLPAMHRLSYAIPIKIYPHLKPVILPTGRLQMNHTPQDRGLLKVIEPPLSVGRIHQSTLMRTIHSCGTLLQHDLTLIGTIDVTGTKNRLPSLSYSTFRDNQVIPAMTLEELRPLCNRTRIDGDAFIQKALAIWRHPMYYNRSCTMLTTSKIRLSVFIPERARIFPLLYALDQVKRSPWAMGILSGTHIQTFIRCAEEHKEASIVIADSWCPRTTSIVLVLVPPRLIETMIYLTHIAPIDHIIRL